MIPFTSRRSSRSVGGLVSTLTPASLEVLRLRFNAPSSALCPGLSARDGSLETSALMLFAGVSYRATLSGVGGDEFMGGVPDPRAQLADLILQFKFICLAKQLTVWSLVKRRPWIRLLWQSALELLPPSVGQYLVEEAKVESWIQKDFAKHTKLAIRQLDVNEHFGLWLPTRRSYVGGVLLMACKLAKLTPPVLALEEARYPYLDQNLIQFLLSIPADQLLRPGERRSLMRRSLSESSRRKSSRAGQNNWEHAPRWSP